MLKRCTTVCSVKRNIPHSFWYSSQPLSHDLRWPGWEVVIGLEVHAQIKSRAKLFSHAWTSAYTEIPNSHVDIFDASFPGTLPKLNSSCITLATRTAIALHSHIQKRSSFDRKHYFYFDLPAGYQITQHYEPFARGGYLRLERSGISVKIKQLQLEQDTAKSVYDAASKTSIIDLNRAGTALMEIVSEPDMKSPEHAGEYLRNLQSLLRSVGSSDGNMEEGSLRCDVNVSVNPIGKPHGARCEIKNLNSVRFMMSAITSEALRQISLLEKGQPVLQETRGFDERTAQTYLLRSKENAPDYRYMPDPNLPPLMLEDEYVASIKDSMPELPDETRARLLAKGLSERDVDFLMSIDSNREVHFDGQLGNGFVSFFDSVSDGRDPKTAFNWITHDLYGQLVAMGKRFLDCPINATNFGGLIDLVEDGQITGTSGKILLKHMLEKQIQVPPSQLAEELFLMALSDDQDLVNDLCLSAIDALPTQAKAVREGNEKVLNRLVGHVMKSSKGRVDVQRVHIRLKELLNIKR